SHGYIRVMLNNTIYAAHRLIWFYMTKRWPKHQIDHRDRDRANNRWDNLRQATNTQNRYNTVSWSRHSVKGVRFIFGRKTKPWAAQIRRNKRDAHLGTFATKEEAHQAYCAAAKQLHGVFFNSS